MDVNKFVKSFLIKDQPKNKFLHFIPKWLCKLKSDLQKLNKNEKKKLCIVNFFNVGSDILTNLRIKRLKTCAHKYYLSPPLNFTSFYINCHSTSFIVKLKKPVILSHANHLPLNWIGVHKHLNLLFISTCIIHNRYLYKNTIEMNTILMNSKYDTIHKS